MKRNLLLIILSAVAFVSCNKDYSDGYYDPPYYEAAKSFITLRNFSSDNTVWFIPDKSCNGMLPAVLTEWQKIAIYEVAAHSSYSMTFDSNDNYVTPIESFGVNDRMTIYVFKKDVWDSHSWSELVNNQLWSSKGEYSAEDFITLNKVVTYPIQ